MGRAHDYLDADVDGIIASCPIETIFLEDVEGRDDLGRGWLKPSGFGVIILPYRISKWDDGISALESDGILSNKKERKKNETNSYGSGDNRVF